MGHESLADTIEKSCNASDIGCDEACSTNASDANSGDGITPRDFNGMTVCTFSPTATWVFWQADVEEGEDTKDVRIIVPALGSSHTDQGEWRAVEDAPSWCHPVVRDTWSALAENVASDDREKFLQGIVDLFTAPLSTPSERDRICKKPREGHQEPVHAIFCPIMSTARLCIGNVVGNATTLTLGSYFTIYIGRDVSGTCTFQSAGILVFAEEGLGSIFVYPFRDLQEARSATDDFWSSRIMFGLEDSGLYEVDWQGPEWYHNIRQAAACFPGRLDICTW
jgi:hypothetical protein